MEKQKHRLRFFSLALALACLLSLLGAIPISSENAPQNQTNYKKKVISVIYDNSASMNTENRISYAKYSLQILVSMLGEDDTLLITPMHLDSAVSPIEIRGGTENMTQKMTDLISLYEIYDAFGGSTPFDSVGRAIAALRDRGLLRLEEAGDLASDTDYWLVIFTDGEFSGIPLEQLEGKIADSILPYSGLHTVYLGFGTEAANIEGCELTRTAPFTAFNAGEKDDLIVKMQRISNLLSGKYGLDPSVYSVSGNTVDVDLEHTDIPFRSMSLLVQDCAVTLQSVTYNGKSISPKQFGVMQGCAEIDMANGYSAVIEGEPFFSGGTLQLTFSGSVPKEKITMMGEPALSICTYFEYEKDGAWKDATVRSINSTLVPGDRIRVRYEVYEMANHTLVDLNQVFGVSEVKITYGGQNYEPLAPIPLKVGGNEVAVSVSVMNGTYTLNDSYICNISQNPSFYRLESEVERGYGGKPEQTRIWYTVYSNNQKLSKSALADYEWTAKVTDQNGNELPSVVALENDGRLSLTLDLAGKPSGVYDVSFEVLSPENAVRTKNDTVNYWAYRTFAAKTGQNADWQRSQQELLGNAEAITFLLEGDGKPLDFDSPLVTYTVTVNGKDVTADTTVQGNVLSFVPTVAVLGDAVSAGSKEVRVRAQSVLDPTAVAEAAATLRITASELLISPVDPSLVLTLHQLIDNQKPLQFRVTLDGEPFLTADTDVAVTLRIGGVDIGDQFAFSGDTISVTPTTALIGRAATLGEKSVEVSAYWKSLPTVTATGTAKLDLQNSVFEIESLVNDPAPVDRFAIGASQTELAFRFLRDGVYLTADEVSEMMESGEISAGCNTFSGFFWLPCGCDVTVKDEGGAGTLRYRITEDQIGLFSLFTSVLILDGDKQVGVKCQYVEESFPVTFGSSPAIQYVWRIALFLLILYIIVYLILFFAFGFAKCKTFPTGTLVTLTFRSDGLKLSSAASVKKINRTFSKRYGWHLRRLLPWNLALNQPDISILTFRQIAGNKKAPKEPPKMRLRKKAHPDPKTTLYRTMLDDEDFRKVVLSLRTADQFQNKAANFTVGTARRMFTPDDTPLSDYPRLEDAGKSSRAFIAEVDDKTSRIKTVYFFVEKKNKK